MHVFAVAVAALAALAAVQLARANCVTTLDTGGVRCSINCPDPADNQCLGCDGVVASGLRFDLCGACGGSNAGCNDCEGTPDGSKDFDVCGVCDGSGLSCSGQQQLDAPTFDPPATTSGGELYLLPLTVSIVPPAADMTVFWKIRNDSTEQITDFVPPNPLSSNGTASSSQPITLEITYNATVFAFVGKSGRPHSYVASATYRVTDQLPGNLTPLLLPIWAICVIAIVGALVVGVLLALYFIWRVRQRKAMVQINLDAAERDAKLEHYKVKYDFDRANMDEIDLRVGDVIAVITKHDDGWWEGRSYRLKGKRGLFPGSYVELVPAERLMWTERPKTMFARFSQRVSQFFSGAPTYGTDPQAPQNTSGFAQRMSRAFGLAPPAPAPIGMTPTAPKRLTTVPAEGTVPVSAGRKFGALPPRPQGPPPGTRPPAAGMANDW